MREADKDRPAARLPNKMLKPTKEDYARVAAWADQLVSTTATGNFTFPTTATFTTSSTTPASYYSAAQVLQKGNQ